MSRGNWGRVGVTPMLTPADQLSVLSDLATGNGVGPSTDPALLDPRNFTPGEIRLAVGLAKRGVPFRDAILPDLSAELARAITKDDPDNGPCLPTITADELLATTFPEPVWAVPGILPCGLAILGGRSKVGKSWLSLQIACAIGTGGRVFGDVVERGRVLFIALEDNGESLQERMVKQGWPAGALVDFLHSENAGALGDLRADGGERMAQHIRAVGYRLVVIDTLSRALRGDQNDADAMTQALAPLQQIALSRNCAILILDHHHKMSGGLDCVSDILGSTAKGAVADTLWGLYRERGKTGAKLGVTGRRVREQELELTWDMTTWAWQYRGEAGKAPINETRAAILAHLATVKRAGVVEIAECVGIDKGNCHKELQGLVADCRVQRIPDGQRIYYSVGDRE